MKFELINHDSTRLLIFFCGFYTDADSFVDLDRGGSDILFVWDYSKLNFDIFDEIDFSVYTQIDLIAYSYGVWAGAGLVRDYIPKPNKSVAIAGTLLPVDDTLGIPRKIFDITLNALSEDALRVFERKAFEGAKTRPKKAKRELQSLKDELLNVRENSLMHKDLCPHGEYDCVILTKNDKIFPYRSQDAFWQGHRGRVELACGHFPFFEFKNFDEILAL